MLIVFIGPPGAGKGTQSERVVNYLGITHLSTGDMLRRAKTEQTLVGKLASEYMDAGRLVPDELIIQVVGERLRQPDCQRGCLLDGFPRTLNQARSLDEYLQAEGRPLDVVLELHVPDDELLKRLLARRRADDNLDTIRQRFVDYKALTEPLVDYYQDRGLLRRIEGIGSPDEVFARIQAVLDAI